MVYWFKIFVILIVLTSCQSFAKAHKTADSVCSTYARTIEWAEEIPSQLLTAISLTETGRWNRQKGVMSSHPWSINVEGSGYFFSSKWAAISAVRRLQALGVKSIDVGCMQINLMHHPNAFNSLEAAFDPTANITYAARFLKGLKKKLASWHNAVAHYHSANAKHHTPYRQKVLELWDQERRKDISANTSPPNFASVSFVPQESPILQIDSPPLPLVAPPPAEPHSGSIVRNAEFHKSPASFFIKQYRAQRNFTKRAPRSEPKAMAAKPFQALKVSPPMPARF